MNKLETARKKREIALAMLRDNARNEDVKEAMRAKFGSGISSSDLSNLRAQLGKVGKNRKRPLPNDRQQSLALVTVPKPDVWVPNNPVSPRLHGPLRTLLETMHQENVTSLAVESDGTVKMHVVQEFVIGG